MFGDESQGVPPEALPPPEGPGGTAAVAASAFSASFTQQAPQLLGLAAQNIIILSGSVPWTVLGQSLRKQLAAAPEYFSVSELGFSDVIKLPTWDSEAGYAAPQAALQAARTILELNPALLILAPGFRQSSTARWRTRAWPGGRVELASQQKLHLHFQDLCWRAVAALMDVIVEAEAARFPSPRFAVILPDAFFTAEDRTRFEPLTEFHLDTVAALPGTSTGAFYQCAWSAKGAAPQPMRVISNVPAFCSRTFPGLPVKRAVRAPTGGPREVYLGPLPRSCGCGRVHPRRSSAEAAASEPLGEGASVYFAELIGSYLQRPGGLKGLVVWGLAAQAAAELLAGPPRRGPPVSSAKLAASRAAWRPLDHYIGRNSRFGDTDWGNPFKVGKDGDAARCCQLFDDHMQKDAVLRFRLGSLRGLRLRCHCLSGESCHADSLARAFIKSGLTLQAPGRWNEATRAGTKRSLTLHAGLTRQARV